MILLASPCGVSAAESLAQAKVAAPADATLLPSAFHVDGNQFIFLKVSIDSAPEVWMLLDTGTSPSVIRLDYARSLGVKLGPPANDGAGAGGSGFQTYPVKVANLRVGTVALENVAFEAEDFGPPGPDGLPIAGVLGYSFLAGKALVLDYPAGKARLIKAGQTVCGVPFQLVSDVPTVSLSVAGQTVSAAIDSGGAYELLLTPTSAGRLGLAGSMAAGGDYPGTGYGGKVVVKVNMSGPDFAIGETIRRKPVVAYLPLPAALPVDGAVGTSFLKDYKVTIDYSAQRICFEQ